MDIFSSQEEGYNEGVGGKKNGTIFSSKVKYRGDKLRKND